MEYLPVKKSGVGPIISLKPPNPTHPRIFFIFSSYAPAYNLSLTPFVFNNYASVSCMPLSSVLQLFQESSNLPLLVRSSLRHTGQSRHPSAAITGDQQPPSVCCRHCSRVIGRLSPHLNMICFRYSLVQVVPHHILSL